MCTGVVVGLPVPSKTLSSTKLSSSAGSFFQLPGSVLVVVVGWGFCVLATSNVLFVVVLRDSNSITSYIMVVI